MAEPPWSYPSSSPMVAYFAKQVRAKMDALCAIRGTGYGAESMVDVLEQAYLHANLRYSSDTDDTTKPLIEELKHCERALHALILMEGTERYPKFAEIIRAIPHEFQTQMPRYHTALCVFQDPTQTQEMLEHMVDRGIITASNARALGIRQKRAKTKRHELA